MPIDTVQVQIITASKFIIIAEAKAFIDNTVVNELITEPTDVGSLKGEAKHSKAVGNKIK